MDELVTYVKVISFIIALLCAAWGSAWLAKKYCFKQYTIWTIMIFFVVFLAGDYYFIARDEVSLIGYLDWILVVLAKSSVPAFVHYLITRRIKMHKWLNASLLILLFFASGYLTAWGLDYFQFKVFR